MGGGKTAAYRDRGYRLARGGRARACDSVRPQQECSRDLHKGAPRPDLVALGDRSLKKPSRHSVAASNLHDGDEIVAEISPAPQDIVIPKGKPSAFFGTPLLSYLIALGVDSLFVAGGATSGCVRASVVDAFSNNYPCWLLNDCCFDRFEASHAMTMFDLGAKYASIKSASDAVRLMNEMG